MKILKIIILLNILFIVNSCSESSKVFMDMNTNIKNGKNYTSAEFLEKSAYFTERRDYYRATHVIGYRLIPICEKENNQECIGKANALLCKIYQDKIDKNDTPGSVLNAFYRPDLAKISCQKAGIKINQE